MEVRLDKSRTVSFREVLQNAESKCSIKGEALLEHPKTNGKIEERWRC